MDEDDLLAGQIVNLPYLEQLYREYQAEPKKFGSLWEQFFLKFYIQKETIPYSAPLLPRSERIANLKENFRKYGHLLAATNPILIEKSIETPQLDLKNLGFQQEELEELFPTLGLLPQTSAPLKTLIQVLKQRYCQGVGFEFKGFTDPVVEEWIQQMIESGTFEVPFSLEEKKLILDWLTRAEMLETFLHTKHVGKKRFSLEGAESVIPMLAMLVAEGAENGVEEFFLGMSHRGRLNVLANILDRPIQTIFKDFDDDYEPCASEGMGDVRYHTGYTNQAVKTYRGKVIKLSIASNPSHLESVDPVVEGQTHAQQFLARDESTRTRIVPLLIHGDAALSGQGVVYETLQMGKLSGFETGGTLHLVINNQIGFTTSPKEGRSTHYCTDIAHTFNAPVFHLNAEDPEACVRLAIFALKIRQKFHCDVFLDLNCYRKYGHNEGDEPSFTQPLEYQLIRKKKSIRSLYLDQLLREEVIDKKAVDEQEENLKKQLQNAYSMAEKEPIEEKDDKKQSIVFTNVSTQVDISIVEEIAERLTIVPPNFHIHPKLEQLMKERARKIKENLPLDWGTVECLAYGSLVLEGVPVRLVGQDSGRGTFSHRHALWVDQENNTPYYPLAHLREKQGRFEAFNTCLSELAALGFEYGYSIICPQGLTIWEAQFGDFVNAAQVVIDQYIASGEQKWGQASGLVLFLPHGLEGQGPEHSSARFERFLSLAAHDNLQIVYPTLPAQLFHLLRRQVRQAYRKPLIVLTPKELLRHPSCVSLLRDLTQGQFHHFLFDSPQHHSVKRLLICTGRIYYDLDAYRIKERREDVVIIRIEQLYPLNVDALQTIIGKYGKFNDCLWVQEEPQNMGAWSFISPYISQILPKNIPLTYVGRNSSAAPATGFYSIHKQELNNILHQAFQT